MNKNELNTQAIKNFDSSKGMYLRVIKTKGQEHLAVTSPCGYWLGRAVRKILMCMGLHSASMGKVAKYLKENENALLNLSVDSKRKDYLKEKLIKYEKNHQIRFTFINTLFGERKGNDLDHKTKIKRIVKSCSLQKSLLNSQQGHESNQKAISEILQKGILPVYKTPMPQFATFQRSSMDSQRVTLSTQSKGNYESYCRKVDQKKAPARDHHGTMHATRVAFWTQVLLQIYRKYDRNNIDNPILLAAAGGFHDTARENEGIDCWDEESGLLFDQFLEQMEMSSEERKKYVQAVSEKDPHHGQFTSDIQRIVHDADCLDIVRVVGWGFSPRFLCFYHFNKKNNFGKEEFIKEAIDFIQITENRQIRTLFEHNSDDFYGDLIRLLFKIQDEQPHRFPLITELIHDQMACYHNDMSNEFVTKILPILMGKK